MADKYSNSNATWKVRARAVMNRMFPFQVMRKKFKRKKVKCKREPSGRGEEGGGGEGRVNKKTVIDSHITPNLLPNLHCHLHIYPDSQKGFAENALDYALGIQDIWPRRASKRQCWAGKLNMDNHRSPLSCADFLGGGSEENI